MVASRGTYVQARGSDFGYDFVEVSAEERGMDCRFQIMDHRFDGEAINLNILMANDHANYVLNGMNTEAITAVLFSQVRDAYLRQWFHQSDHWNGRLVITMSGQVTFSEGDPYTYEGVDVLPAFGSWVASNAESLPPYHLPHLMTGITNLPYGGLATVGGVCNPSGAGWSLAFGSSYEILRHEIGHQLGALHDDASVCEDTCAGWDVEQNCFEGHMMGGNTRDLFSACSINSISNHLDWACASPNVPEILPNYSCEGSSQLGIIGYTDSAKQCSQAIEEDPGLCPTGFFMFAYQSWGCRCCAVDDPTSPSLWTPHTSWNIYWH